jgi:hypothetical protein
MGSGATPVDAPACAADTGVSKNRATVIRVRVIKRVQLHADLTILAKLSCALSRASALPLAA